MMEKEPNLAEYWQEKEKEWEKYDKEIKRAQKLIAEIQYAEYELYELMKPSEIE